MRGLIGTLTTIVALALAPTALAGQIVYTHGGDLWAMNDNGSNQHVLATASQVGGTIGSGFNYYDGVGIQPNGTDIAFDAQVPDTTSYHDCSGYCPGIYTLIGGKLTRLSSPPYKCGNGTTVGCEKGDVNPVVTSNGQLLYIYQWAINVSNGCGYSCTGETSGDGWTLYSRPIDGSGGPTAWPFPNCTYGTSGYQPFDACPNATGGIYDNVFASDPADPTKIAYAGLYEDGLQPGQECGSNGDSLCYPITIEDSDLDYNEPSFDTGGYSGFAFSSDGSVIADVEPAGIGVYPMSQNVGHSNFESTTQTQDQVFHWALGYSNTNASSGGVNGDIAFAGSATGGKIIFSALNNLYSIPASCFATATDSTPGCGVLSTADPTSNPDITQLTTNGTSANPNLDPAWTSSDATLEPLSTGNGNGNGNGNGGGTTFKVTVTAASGQKVLEDKALIATVKCNVACGFAAIGAFLVKHSSKEYDTKHASGRLSASHSKTVILKFSSSELKALEKALAKRKKVYALIVVEAEDAAGKELTKSSRFTIKH